ncbi:MAG: TRAP transporter small permease [Gammaproteobacteria bacterium]|nr:TRAP transporter small permease [Gammaproteobacteria bacterium]
MDPRADDVHALKTGRRVQFVLYRLLGGFAALLLFLMMLLTFTDVIGRYIFNFPIPGGFEVTEIMLATMIFAGLPLVSSAGEHITVDLFDSFIPASVNHFRNILLSLVATVIMAVVSIRLWEKADEAVGYGDVTAVLHIPFAPMFYFMSIALGITSLVFLMLAWQQLRRRASR